MKKKSILYLVTVSLYCCISLLAYSQDSDTPSSMKPFGVGLHFEQIKFSEMNMDMYLAPANKLVLIITPVNSFRLEPEIGFISVNDKVEELKDKAIQFGFGGYGMIQKGKMNIYSGLKLESSVISSEYREYGSSTVETTKYKRFSFGPVIGAEIFFAEYFSFGGEFSLKFSSIKSENDRYSDEGDDIGFSSTDSGLLVRFYF